MRPRGPNDDDRGFCGIDVTLGNYVVVSKLDLKQWWKPLSSVSSGGSRMKKRGGQGLTVLTIVQHKWVDCRSSTGEESDKLRSLHGVGELAVKERLKSVGKWTMKHEYWSSVSVVNECKRLVRRREV
jgi:hypothetical protein